MSAQSDAEWAEDDDRYRDQMIGRLMLELEQMLQELHECALAEDQVRARHKRVHPIYVGADYCAECENSAYPCPTLLDMIGPQVSKKEA